MKQKAFKIHLTIKEVEDSGGRGDEKAGNQ